MKLAPARKIAEKYLTVFAPYCTNAEIAGSTRREKPEVGDLEIVLQPRADRDIFGNPNNSDTALDEAIRAMLRTNYLPLPLKDGPRYKQFLLHEGIMLDLFIVRPPAQWGVIFTIRTGPVEFSRWIVTQRKRGGALPSHCRVENSAVLHGLTSRGEIIPTPREIDFLNFLGLEWIPPSARHANLPIPLHQNRSNDERTNHTDT